MTIARRLLCLALVVMLPAALGTRYEYSNSGYWALAEIIRVARDDVDTASIANGLAALFYLPKPAK